MSNSVGHNLIQQHFLRPTVLEHQSKLKNSSVVPTNSFCATASLNESPSQPRKYKISTKFYGNTISEKKQKSAMGSQRASKFIPQAVLAAGPASEVKISCLFMLSVFEFYKSAKKLNLITLPVLIFCNLFSLIWILGLCWQESVVMFVWSLLCSPCL